MIASPSNNQSPLEITSYSTIEGASFTVNLEDLAFPTKLSSALTTELHRSSSPCSSNKLLSRCGG